MTWNCPVLSATKRNAFQLGNCLTWMSFPWLAWEDVNRHRALTEWQASSWVGRKLGTLLGTVNNGRGSTNRHRHPLPTSFVLWSVHFIASSPVITGWGRQYDFHSTMKKGAQKRQAALALTIWTLELWLTGSQGALCPYCLPLSHLPGPPVWATSPD